MIFLNILRRAALSVLQLLLHSIAENRTPRHTVDHLRNKKFIYQFAQKKATYPPSPRVMEMDNKSRI